MTLFVLLLLFIQSLPPCPQFPAADVCERNSWNAWDWREGFLRSGWFGPEAEAMVEGNTNDSWAWWECKTMQSPRFTTEQRADAAKKLHDRIGEQRFNAGLMPDAVPFPYDRPERHYEEKPARRVPDCWCPRCDCGASCACETLKPMGHK